MRRLKSPRWLLLLPVWLCLSVPAQADPGDLLAILTHVPTQRTLLATLSLVVGVMFVNYVVNMIIVGLPVSIFVGAPVMSLATRIGWLTLLGQAADRVGAIASLAAIGALHGLLPRLIPRGTESWVLPSIFYLCCAGFLFLVVSEFLRYHWSLTPKQRHSIACAAALITNPLWGLMAFFGTHSV